jgi:glutamate-1-semialdehyde aminotransferase
MAGRPARIGGDIADIQQTAGVMTDTGAAASESSTEASRFSSQMEREINDVTSALANHFNQMADGLRQRIGEAKNRLAATDWEGTSQAEATEAEAALNSDVSKVLDNALDSTNDFKTFMLKRANDFVTMVDRDFKTIMGNIDTAYQDLGKASRTFAENLQTADESIKFG